MTKKRADKGDEDEGARNKGDDVEGEGEGVGLGVMGCREQVQTSPELITAIKDGNISEVKSIIEEKPNLVNSMCTLYVLSESNGVPRSLTIEGTPLYNAVYYGHKDIVKLLLEKGAKENAQVKNGFIRCQTPLLLAKEKQGKGNSKIYELLMANNENVRFRDKFGNTALHRACYKNISQEDLIDVVELLINKGADVNAKNKKEGSTALHIVTYRHNKEIVQLLVKKGADVNVKNKYGITPLHYVGNINITEFLIAKGADINAKDNKGYTPLHNVATKVIKSENFFKYELSIEQTIPVAEHLIANGADVNAKDKDGKTPLKLAIEKDNKEIIILLRKHGAIE